MKNGSYKIKKQIEGDRRLHGHCFMCKHMGHTTFCGMCIKCDNINGCTRAIEVVQEYYKPEYKLKHVRRAKMVDYLVVDSKTGSSSIKTREDIEKKKLHKDEKIFSRVIYYSKTFYLFIGEILLFVLDLAYLYILVFEEILKTCFFFPCFY